MGKRLLLVLLLARGAQAELTVHAVGDVRISSRFLTLLSRLKLAGDVVFANFEGVLYEPDAPDPWKFCMPFNAIEALRGMGLNSLSVANNHALDMGPAAYVQGVRRLREAGFSVAEGAGPGTTRGRVRIVGFSFCTPNHVNKPVKLKKGRGEILIVSAHMGAETHLSHWIPQGGEGERGDVVRFSHACIDAGADLVLGHSPHIPRGLELYKGKLIVYSLGNFAFDYPHAPANRHAIGYSIAIKLADNGNFRGAHIHSYDLRQGIPVPDPTHKAYFLIQDLTRRNLKQRALSFPGNGEVR